MPDPVGDHLLPNLPLALGLTVPLAPLAVWQWRKAPSDRAWIVGARSGLLALAALPLTLLLGRFAFELVWPTHEITQQPCPRGCFQLSDVAEWLEPHILVPLNLAIGLAALALLSVASLLLRLRRASALSASRGDVAPQPEGRDGSGGEGDQVQSRTVN